ncbi:PucR-like helix-turn-helix protein [Scopulibacillus darangshiensis]|uniref:PucR-like helix-turn-helix protein n=1 Tax=Scopulibacillus darangshiensis TaxID=442528 RepID=A0A4R2P453_9BACL|nr:PucR family transcriptional regulator [Scopulibacillus darangshiensis]TCP29589.1 PucR-like helix-turn-helix protein [Scopulibacillus darangshiensis]
MDVKEAMSIGGLEKGEIVAGNKGVNRPVRAVEVMEVPDTTSWLTEGLLIVTTFYAIKDNPEAQINFFQTLIKEKGAGLVIKPGRFIKNLPEEMYRLANQNNMPLITVPNDVVYGDILTPLYEELYKERSADLGYYQVLASILDTTDQDLNHIVNRLEDYLGNPVYIEDTKTRLLAASQEKLNDDWRRSYFLLTKASSGFQRFINNPETLEKLKHGKCPVKVGREEQRESRVIFPIRDNNQLLGFITVIEKNQPLEEENDALLQQVASHLSLLLIKDRFSSQAQQSLEREFVNDLIEGNILPGELEHRAAGLGIHSHHASFFLTLNYQSYLQEHAEEQDVRSQDPFVLQQIKTIVQPLFEKTMIFFKRNQLYLFCSVPSEKDVSQAVKEKGHQMIERINQAFHFPFNLGIGRVYCDLNDVYRSYEKAQLVLKIGRDVWGTGQAVHFDQLGVYRFLMKLRNDSETLQYAHDLLRPLLDYDRKNLQSQLVKSLKVYLQTNGNVTKASELLFVHRSTLKYRLKKIQDITHMDLDDSEMRLQFQVAFKLLSMHSDSSF